MNKIIALTVINTVGFIVMGVVSIVLKSDDPLLAIIFLIILDIVLGMIFNIID